MNMYTDEHPELSRDYDAAGSGEGIMRFMRDSDEDGSDPIVSHRWLLLYNKHPNHQLANAIKDFVWWELSRGQAYAREIGCGAIPKRMVARASDVVDKVHH